MKVKGNKTRCDGCGRVISEKHPDAQKFKGFYLPPSINMATGLPDGKFPGIARAGCPGKLLEMHACPGCQPAIRKLQSKYEIALLPDGPLKKALREITTPSLIRRVKTLPSLPPLPGGHA